MNEVTAEVTLASEVKSANSRLLAYVTLTFQGPLGTFVLRDVKVIWGNHGVFVAMPSRKMQSRCHGCRGSNDVLAHYCNWCGVPVSAVVADRVYADTFYPIDRPSRDRLDRVVMKSYEARKKERGHDAGPDANGG